ncbi:unnamed protein product [Dibothriocephalus latus]|uniref:Cystatin domain-containing protein n=1 Tax=Dibothriocephalus latus TaxID=60516 RepID=A0A3P7L8R7_DIBLA|nr:unnamed protein product [Dibothriocephalus latus]
MPGGWRPLSQVEMNSETFREAVTASLEELGDESRGCCSYFLQKVLSGTQQTVAGVRYEWFMKVYPVLLSSNRGCAEVCNAASEETPTYSASAWVKPYADPKKVEVSVRQV